MAEHGASRAREGVRDDRRAPRSGARRSGDALVVTGEPGMGKTALLGYAADRADGMRVLRAQGVHAESRLPFAGLHALLRPALDLLPAPPTAQADALSAALGLDEPKGQSRFLVAAGVLGLLAELAEPGTRAVPGRRRPVGRRLVHGRAVLRGPADRVRPAGDRGGGPAGRAGVARAGRAAAGPDRARPGRPAADRARPDLDAPSRRRIVELAAGNPLALVELGDDVPAPTASGAARPRRS